MRVISTLLAAACLLTLFATPAAADTVVVHVYNFDFSINPSGQPIVDATIHVGDTVRWVWDGGFHSTTSIAGMTESWDSGVTSMVGFTFEHTFTHEGVFTYYCTIHGSDTGGGASGMAGTVTVLSTAATLTDLTLNPTSVIGGASSTGTVKLSSGAPTGGAVINLSSSDTTVATVPATVTIPEGATTADFTINTNAVSTSTDVTISASYEGVTKEATLTVNPALSVASVTLDPAVVAGGAGSTGTVTLTIAPSENTTVTLQSSHPAASVPASVTVLAGSTSANFPINTVAVTSTQSPVITATLSGSSRTATLTVHPPIKKVSVSPADVPGGCKKVTGKVILNGKASAPLTIDLSETHPAASLAQSSIIIPAGATSKTFTLNTDFVATTKTGSVTASCLGVSKSATLKVRPIAVASVSLAPNPVVGGNPVEGLVTLECAAELGDIVVTLSTTKASVAKPDVGSITIPVGQKTGVFTVTTSDVSALSSATIKAKAQNTTITKGKKLTVQP